MARQRVQELLEEHRRSGLAPCGARRLEFRGVEGLDVYNPARPLREGGRELLPARVEARDSERSSVLFFRQAEPGGIWRPEPNSPAFELQDPFWARVQGELVFGGVEVFPKAGGKPGELAWRMRLYRDRGSGLDKLEPFLEGPLGMKDIRLCDGPGGSVALLTRPQGEIGGRGKIGFALVESLDRLDASAFAKAELFDQLEDDEWCGSNQATYLGNGQIGVLGHVARFSADGDRHYYPAAFRIDAARGEAGPWKILAERSDLPEGPWKRPDLRDVLFPGGLVRSRAGEGRAELYLGVSDAEVMVCSIEDPFSD